MHGRQAAERPGPSDTGVCQAEHVDEDPHIAVEVDGVAVAPIVWIVIAVVAALAIGAAMIAVVASTGSSSTDVPSTIGLEQTQPVTVTGTALAALPDGGRRPGASA